MQFTRKLENLCIAIFQTFTEFMAMYKDTKFKNLLKNM